jgi:integrase/recombinase XerD
VRNIAVLELLFSTGAKVSEIAGIREENINLNSGNIIIKGKGNKERVIEVCNKESLVALRTYYGLFKEKIRLANGYFLVNRLN